MKKYVFTALIFWSTTSFGQEALWLRTPSVSPDGSKIAFGYKGDIFIHTLATNSTKQLTQHVGYETNPVWSPDGRLIAFSSDRFGNFDAFTVNAEGGSAKQITFHSMPDMVQCFSPDGKKVLFASPRIDHINSMLYPTPAQPELYSVDLKNGVLNQEFTGAAFDVKYSSDGKKILYTEKRGYEDASRKHQNSSFSRRIWEYDLTTGNHMQITGKPNQDIRNPVELNGDYYFLREGGTDFNIWKKTTSKEIQLTRHKKHPVRSMTISSDGKICYSFDGKIYIKQGDQPEKEVKIVIEGDQKENDFEWVTQSSWASDFDISPNGKEIVFVARGSVFVTSIDFKTTKRITQTNGQERNVSFSKEGDKILYASERDGSWNIYETEKKDTSEKYFYASTLLKETALLETKEDVFQPVYSPDGMEVAYLENRITLKVVELKSKKVRTVLEGQHKYSYYDGDQTFEWSPDGKWLLTNTVDTSRWRQEISVVRATGKEEPINITKSGYYDFNAKWILGGEGIIWMSDRNGMKSHGSWGSQFDVYASFFTQEAYDKFRLTKEERELLEKEEQDSSKTIEYDFEEAKERKMRLTIHSSLLSDALLSEDGKKLFYLSKFEKGFDLWVHDLEEQETKKLTTLNKSWGRMSFDKDKKNIYLLVAGGSMFKINPKNGKKTAISFSAKYKLDHTAEREYIFEHIWRTMKEKFYVKDMHGVDWTYYKKEYKKFLPHINNNYDFRELLSEMLGELNASHTGARYRFNNPTGNKTASLALFFEEDDTKKGLKIAEVIKGSPVINKEGKVKKGVTITHVDGVEVNTLQDYYKALNRKAGERVLVTYKGDKTWNEVVKPISFNSVFGLLYKRWIKRNEAYVEKLSGGKYAYVHVKTMNDAGFRATYDKVLGEYSHKKALVVDTRWNGGGWLHVDLIDMLNGHKYFEFEPRGQHIGTGPHTKWIKPSIVVVNEGNYSNAHMFPYIYKEMKIGKLVGTPVPGTGTAVWWERQIDPTIIFGIPQVGIRGTDGKFLENNQLEPDVLIELDPAKLDDKEDVQLRGAVEELGR